MLYGEAPGPLGADKSAIPFWGDKAGIVVYRALEAAGLASVPPEAYEDWDGARLRERGLRPELRGAALSNAYPSCPTQDGQTFKAPTDKELKSPENLQRIEQELSEGTARCEGRLRVIALGRRAAWILAHFQETHGYELCERPHPSAQGLLQAAPDKGRGMKLADLQKEWEARLVKLLSR